MTRPSGGTTPAWTVAGARDLVRFRLIHAPKPSAVIAERRIYEDAAKIRWRAVELAAGRATEPVVDFEERLSFFDFDVAMSAKTALWIFEVNGPSGAIHAVEDAMKPLAELVRSHGSGRSSAADLPKDRDPEIAVGTGWHRVIDAERWLFRSRVRKSTGDSWLITCNSLDGRILQMRGPRHDAPAGGFDRRSAQWELLRFGEHGLYPVGIEADGSLLSSIAYVAVKLSDNLFVSLDRRSPAKNPRGALYLERPGESPLNVSAQAELGAVYAFDMDAVDSREILLAAAHEAGGKWTLTALTSSDGGRAWKTAAVLPLPGPASQVAALASRSGPSYVAFALPDKDDFTTIRAIALGRE